MTVVDDILSHHGIKGMHWGIRSAGKSSGETRVIEHPVGHEPMPTHNSSGAKITYVHEHAAGKAATDQIIKQHGIQAVSNHQLRSANERTDLESRYQALNPTRASRGSQFVKDLVGQTAKQQTTAAVNRQIAKTLATKAAKVAVVAAVA